MEARLAQAAASLETWQQAWITACTKASLEVTLRPEQVTEALQLMAELETKIGEIQDLRVTRIGAMRRDLDAFALQVKAIVSAAANDLTTKAPTDSLDELAIRLNSAQRVAAEAQRLRREIAEANKRLEGAQSAHQTAVAQLEPLLQQAGVKELEALPEAIRKSDQCRELDGRIDTLERDLIGLGDGLSLADLTIEAQDQDRDLIRARLLEIEDALKRLSDDRQRIGGDIADAEAKLRSMQGSDAASMAAETRQQALADMGDAIERWTRLTVSASRTRRPNTSIRFVDDASLLPPSANRSPASACSNSRSNDASFSRSSASWVASRRASMSADRSRCDLDRFC